MRRRRLTLALAVLTAVVLILSLPGALRDAWERGGIYLFSREFLADIPARLAGPGRFRFVVQPTVAAVIGFAAGRADARARRPPYLRALVLGEVRRRELVREAFDSTAHLVLAGVMLDAISQWLILGVSHPGAALVVGPVLIFAPYAVARALANRATRSRSSMR